MTLNQLWKMWPPKNLITELAEKITFALYVIISVLCQQNGITSAVNGYVGQKVFKMAIQRERESEQKQGERNVRQGQHTALTQGRVRLTANPARSTVTAKLTIIYKSASVNYTAAEAQ